MNSLNTIIDYELIDSLDIEFLKNNLILPIKKDGIFFNIFSCTNSNIKALEDGNIIREKELNKEEILFFLDDIKRRKTLFLLSKNAVLNEENNINYIEDFFKILIKKAVEVRSSDIHIESIEKALIIRFRIDGNLKIFYTFQKEFLKVLSSYIKMLSKLDITQSRTPMDGRFSLYLKEKKFDFRVSTMPTIYGESIVIRVLDNKNITKKLQDLGFSKRVYNSIKEIEKLSSGLVLIAGPTGSGKSTTLYSILKELNKENKKIITIEDPVEYKMEGIQQIEVNEKLGVTFQKVLKNVLRQDPDIILIGEIRDENSLAISLQASLTGHLVFASIHANNTVETFSRLKDLKADKFLLSASLRYILSQRLVLNICKKCKAKGCELCSFTGFYGRSCISEILKIDEEISSIIMQNKDIKTYLNSISFKTILDDGKESVEKGITTMQEVYKVINE